LARQDHSQAGTLPATSLAPERQPASQPDSRALLPGARWSTSATRTSLLQSRRFSGRFTLPPPLRTARWRRTIWRLTTDDTRAVRAVPARTRFPTVRLQMAARTCGPVRWLQSTRGSASAVRRRQPNGQPRARSTVSIFRKPQSHQIAWIGSHSSKKVSMRSTDLSPRASGAGSA